MTNKKQHVYLFILAIICIVNGQYFPLNMWKNYDLNNPSLCFSHSQSTHQICLMDRQTSKYQAQYFFAGDSMLMKFKSESKQLTVLSTPNGFVISGLENQQRIAVKLNSKEQKHVATYNNFKAVQGFLQSNEQNQMVLKGSYDMIVIGRFENFSKQLWEATLLQTRQKAKSRLVSWMKINQIPEQHNMFAQQMLSQTLSNLCKEKSHIGLCDLAHFGTHHQKYEIDLRHSFLIIDLLSRQYIQLSLFLFEHMINLYEDRLFYEEDHLAFVTIPEHISLFNIYYKVAKNDRERLEGFSIRVKAVLNGLMNQMLLADVNNLQEEKNYRQTNNLHPTLFKMLNMRWRAKTAKKAVSSIYEESFTPDYFYNYPHEITSLCISKIAWLVYASAEFTRLINQIGDQMDLAALEQPLSLLKIVKNFMNSDKQAQKGYYYPVNTVPGGIRMYGKQIGYESLLPFVYSISDYYPDLAFTNLTTPYGLSSLQIKHPKTNSRYEFRDKKSLAESQQEKSQIYETDRYVDIKCSKVDFRLVVRKIQKFYNVVSGRQRSSQQEAVIAAKYNVFTYMEIVICVNLKSFTIVLYEQDMQVGDIFLLEEDEQSHPRFYLLLSDM